MAGEGGFVCNNTRGMRQRKRDVRRLVEAPLGSFAGAQDDSSEGGTCMRGEVEAYCCFAYGEFGQRDKSSANSL